MGYNDKNYSSLLGNESGLLFDTTFKYKSVEMPNGNCEIMNNRFAKPIYASPGEIILKTGNQLIDSENNLYEESDPRKNVPDSRLSQGYRYKGPEVLKDTTKNVMISRRYYYEKILNKKSLIRKGYKYNSTANIIPNTQYTLNDNDVQNVIKKAINAVVYIEDCNMIGIKFDNNTYTVTYYSNIDFKNDTNIVKTNNNNDCLIYLIDELTPY